MTSFDTTAPFLPEILSLHGKWKGNKPAIICDDETVTWRAFDTATNSIAHTLIARGMRIGSAVGVVMNNSRDMIEILVGIMKSGACSVPINLSVSDEALAVMLVDADVKIVFATPEQQNRFAAFQAQKPDVPVVIVGARSESFSLSSNTTLPAVNITDDTPLNIIYSSGTTGTPKGILHTHKGRRDWAYDLAIALRYTSAARTLFTIGLYSNISWVGMLCTLLAGGTMVIHKSFDPLSVLRDIERHKITNFAMVPIQLQRLHATASTCTFDISSIEAIMSCGSPLHAQLKSELFALFGSTVVIELFGLTEGVITTLDPEEAAGRMASVGKPLIGTDIKIVDDNNKEATPGAPGEIVGRGRIVMPGYLNRPEATAEATWLDADGKAWLRTGDIGHLDEDGYLYIVDRKKDMILSGGQNIYPQDIEALLIENEVVSEVAVIGVPCPRWGETPIAIVVASAKIPPKAEALTAWANERLGKQQRLRQVVYAENLPRNPNGKILKRELRKQYESILDD